jgi:hypothetical protein
VTDFTIGTLRRDDFVLLTDDIKCWIVEIEDISLLEASGDETRGDAKAGARPSGARLLFESWLGGNSTGSVLPLPRTTSSVNLSFGGLDLFAQNRISQ